MALVSAMGNLGACYTPGEVLPCKMGDEHSYTLPPLAAQPARLTHAQQTISVHHKPSHSCVF
jgi:hypothetical protein